MVHPDTDPEALGQDKPALTFLAVLGHFHELTMNIDFVRYTIFGAFCHCGSFLALFRTFCLFFRVNNLRGHMIQGTLQPFPHQGNLLGVLTTIQV
jgi:hypothetical protein